MVTLRLIPILNMTLRRANLIHREHLSALACAAALQGITNNEQYQSNDDEH